MYLAKPTRLQAFILILWAVQPEAVTLEDVLSMWPEQKECPCPLAELEHTADWAFRQGWVDGQNGRFSLTRLGRVRAVFMASGMSSV